MNGDPYRSREEQSAAVRRQPRTPWPLIIGVVVLAILAVVLALMVLTGDGTAAGASPTPEPTPSIGASATATASASVAPSSSAASPPAGPSAAPSAEIEIDALAATTVDGLAVRADPGTGAEKRGSLASGTVGFVVEGPVEADGYRWYRLSGLGPPPNSGCVGPPATDPFECPTWFGWVAGSDPAGAAWLTPSEVDCPGDPLTAEALIAGRTPLQRLACFGDEPITFRAWWPELPDDAGLGGACASQDEPSGWLLCQNVNQNYVTIDETQGFEGIGIRVSIDPASGLSMPGRGTWLELRAHFDHPAAEGCDEAALAAGPVDGDPAQLVLDCRAQLVLEAVQAVDGQ